MKFKKKDVKHHIMMPDCTFVELNDGTKIYNYRNKKNYIIIKNGKRHYKPKFGKIKEKDMITFGKIVEAIGNTI